MAVSRALRWALVAPAMALASVTVAATATVAVAQVSPSVSVTSTPSAYAPVTPARLLDTRFGIGGTLVPAGSTVTVPVAGRAGIPADATAVVANLTVTEAGGAGYVTAFPAGATRPTASNLNKERAGQTVANLVTVPVGAGGAIALFASNTTHLVLDVLGAYTPAATATSGRFVAVDPVRVLDTRQTTPFAPAEQRTVPVGGVPADAIAVVVNLTVTGASAAPGYWTAWAAGTPKPATSNVNVAVRGQTVPNQAIVPLQGGAIDVFSQSGGHLLVDLAGYLTGPSAPDSDVGLFVPVAPSRLLDTREAVNPLGAGVKPLPGWRLEVPTAGVLPPNAAAVVGTTTAVHGTRAGHVTVWPAGQPQPDTSNVNVTSRQTVANHTVALVGERGLSYYTYGGAHLLFDLVGWYTGTPRPSPLPAPANVPDPSGMPTTPLTLDQGGVLVPGAGGPIVAAVQSRLEALGFWLDGADGDWGYNTSQALMAFQKWNGLPTTPVVDVGVWEALRTATRPVARTATGNMIEVDKTRQVMLVVRNGVVTHVINVSTGSEIPYVEPNRVTGGISTGDSITREGRFKVYREYSAGWESGELGELYRPKYFDGGIAIHGSNDVPDYPASHGCVRVSNPFMDYVWATNLIPMRSDVWVYR